MHTAQLGFWWRALGGPPAPRPPLPGPAEADVAIVGAGLTGLWTAYYLSRARPDLRIIVLEEQVAGFGASGRNGGWVSGFFSGPSRVYERRGGPAALSALQRAMFETVDEIGEVIARHGIDAEFVKSGHISAAIGAAQAERLRADIASARARGLGPQDLRVLSFRELAERVRIEGALGASFSPHVARVQPAKLVAGLARVVEDAGVVIHEGTAVTEIRPHQALTRVGIVRARWVVRATEGYTAGLRGMRRALVPMNSSMIITEPLDPGVMREIGWQGREVLGDEANVYVYLQRTDDGRIAIGGRGVPYRFGSRTDGRGYTAPVTIESLRAKLTSMFPAAAGAVIDHAWSGVLGVPRNWCVSVTADARSGIASAGGYVGEGVGASNLAGRILRDLILEAPSARTGVPWVGPGPRRWEPEPLRWAMIQSVYALYRHADRIEHRTGRRSRLAALVDRASGRI
jgi:glycine/D-amino acid oxidase-like deaminating enzyme